MATRIIVSGRVQGVSFRAFTRAEARRLGLRGWVRNLEDGRVEAVAEGERVRELVEWCQRGSPLSRVETVKTEPVADTGRESFEILR